MLLLAAADDANPVSFQILPFVTALIIFGIAFGILATQVWPKILKGLDERERKIRTEIESAEEARARAQEAMREYEQSLAGARQEAAEMISKAKSDARAAAEELRARNDAELSDLKRRATAEIESAKQSAINELHAEASVLAAAIASRILEREITADDQKRLVEEALRELRASAAR